MKFFHPSSASFFAKAYWLVMAGALLLVGCHSSPANSAQLTGNQGGSLAGLASSPIGQLPGLPQGNGMKVLQDGKVIYDEPRLPDANLNMAVGLTKPDAGKSSTPPGYSGLIQQVLPDGHIFIRELLNGQRMSEYYYSSLRVPERAVFYVNDNVIAGTAEYGLDGKLTRRTYFYVGTSQPQRVEEYADGVQVAKFTTYWPNGNLRMISETGFPTPAGPVNRIQEWYQNGEPLSLAQYHVERDDNGDVLLQEKQGRQTLWDENGFPTQDREYDHDRLLHDYLLEKKDKQP